MVLFGTPIETIYLTTLIVAGILTILFLLFGDILEGIGEMLGIFNPVLILAFLTFTSASGYILESLTTLNSILILIISILTGLLLVTLLNIFILIPMSSAEESLSYTEESLKGRVGKVIIPIPENGFGEVVIDSKSGRISKPAACYENKIIQEGQQVLIINVEKGVLYVETYENNLDIHQLS
ncbi:NfeD family protein [Oceanobacillus chungangensis]|uniref:Membrane protein NfeD2 N-terminal transmembrane domain-containing protein n=1 Tax=Oceanobacillus chungangensis TaxID=1229152 RepID=A0A3D8PKB8_9BACI|nr:NfeD family protein [Oceanobacillus chungangensis]RDW15927.1 hypothetical protein CWR45_15640 [Oceanobacillus chungangensis]